MNVNKTIAVSFLTVFGTFSAHTQESEDDLIRALQDEMDRSLNELQIEDEPKPYYISYTVSETVMITASAVLGAQEESDAQRQRSLSVKVRVGSKELDNTNFLSFGSGGIDLSNFVPNILPLTNSYEELRRAIWRATDAAYKQAVSDLASKKAALENSAEVDRPHDFSEEEPFTYMGEEAADAATVEAVENIARDVSKALRGKPDIFTSQASALSVKGTQIFMDSEGNFNRLEGSLCGVMTTAQTRSEAGATIEDSTFHAATSCEELPSVADMMTASSAMARNLLAQRNAEELNVYSGPVLFEGQAAAEFVGQTLAGLFAAYPLPKTDDRQMDSMLQQNMANPFLDKIDARVMPRFLSVINDPTVEEFEGASLMGSYIVDSEGVASRRSELVVNGFLRSMLSARAPVKEITNSTGSFRGTGPSPGNLFI